MQTSLLGVHKAFYFQKTTLTLHKYLFSYFGLWLLEHTYQNKNHHLFGLIEES